MILQRQRLITLISQLVEVSITKAQLSATLRGLAIINDYPEVFVHGKAKTTLLHLDEMTDDAIIESANLAIKRFHGIGEGKALVDQIKEIIGLTKDEVLNLYFGSSSKPDIYISDLSRGTIAEIDVKDFLKVVAKSDDVVSWRFVLDQLLPGIANIEDLIVRLRQCIPQNSDPAKRFFESYIRQTVGRGNLDAPALLPELYLHYDPMTKAARGGTKAVDSQRIDFYMKIAEREILLEIDGMQHFSYLDGKPNKAGYGSQCAWDRERLIKGYEIYRFGTGEFVDNFEVKLEEFMLKLIKKSDILL